MEETWTSETRPGLFYLEKPQAKKQVNLNTDRTELTELSDNSNSMTEGLVRHKSILLMDIHEKQAHSCAFWYHCNATPTI